MPAPSIPIVDHRIVELPIASAGFRRATDLRTLAIEVSQIDTDAKVSAGKRVSMHKTKCSGTCSRAKTWPKSPE
jgi:hypothetical protein